MSNDFAKDYIPVNERIEAFYAKHPDGSLQSELVELSESRVVMKGYAYRSPDDARPGIGYSSLEIPGRTPYTRGSEIENAETSAWGRAIAALGFEVKRGIATAEDVAAKSGQEPAGRPQTPPAAPSRVAAPPRPAVVAEDEDGVWPSDLTVNPNECPDHHKPYRSNAKGMFCPTKLDDGTWCQQPHVRSRGASR